MEDRGQKSKQNELGKNAPDSLLFSKLRYCALQKREVPCQGIYKVKLKVALNEKRKKLHGFSFSINMANFEAFWGVKKMSANLSFLKYVT